MLCLKRPFETTHSGCLFLRITAVAVARHAMCSFPGVSCGARALRRGGAAPAGVPQPAGDAPAAAGAGAAVAHDAADGGGGGGDEAQHEAGR